ncbi:hypothetical protein HWD35_02215 [Tsukamurella tyrosinosolvens]|uniref:hypothetical protein n=1 Tax=Tsukamurella tyrosinosolvens TaxID=57704 RepID=UPI000A8207C5|nr:hypothetical protein [Tsukamurella tyrosinosolvens]MCA4993516.1 hypothetical protein [Tsukamurella tyrosinosolvens]
MKRKNLRNSFAALLEGAAARLRGDSESARGAEVTVSQSAPAPDRNEAVVAECDRPIERPVVAPSPASQLHQRATRRAARLRSDPDRTQERVDELREYMVDNVDDGERLVCQRQNSCRASIDPGQVTFHGGQLSHVGKHYDLSDGYMSWRVLVIAMETGREREHVTLEQRREEVAASADTTFQGRNPHMRGTASALRLAYGGEPGRDRAGELLRLENESRPVHIFDAYAMINVRLCSAVVRGTTTSRGTKTMSQNCFPHLRKSVEILEPDFVIFQGKGARRDLGGLIRTIGAEGGLERATIGNHQTLLATLNHPSAQRAIHNWGQTDRQEYLLSTVMPTIREARRRHLGRD